VRSEEGRVEVNSALRGRWSRGRWRQHDTMTKSLRKRTVVARSEGGVEVAACSGAGIVDGRWRRWRNSF
jgi:hypothetical protein